jgi:hypothetical protein
MLHSIKLRFWQSRLAFRYNEGMRLAPLNAVILGLFLAFSAFADPRPIFDIVLDLDKTVLMPLGAGEVAPPGARTLEQGPLRYYVAPFFENFVASLKEHPRARFRFSFYSTRTREDLHHTRELLSKIPLRGGNALELCEGRIAPLNPTKIAKDLVDLNRLGLTPPLDLNRAISFDDNPGWLSLFNLVGMENQKVGAWLAARGLVEELVESSQGADDFLMGRNSGRETYYQLHSQKDYERLAERGEKILQEQDPLLKLQGADLCSAKLSLAGKKSPRS